MARGAQSFRAGHDVGDKSQGTKAPALAWTLTLTLKLKLKRGRVPLAVFAWAHTRGAHCGVSASARIANENGRWGWR